MKCEKARKLLSDNLDQSLPMREDLVKHLASCPSCATELRGLEKMRRAARLLSQRQAPEAFTARVMAAVSQAPQRVAAPIWTWGRAIRWASLPAAALTGLAIWIGVNTVAGPPPEVAAERNHRVCVQAYAEYRSQQALSGPEMLVIGTEYEDDSDK